MAYSSNIKLPLAQEPKSPNQDMFPDLIDIYNSIHILGQGLSQFVNRSGDANTPPWEAMPFERWFFSPAAEAISAGNIVTVVNVKAGHQVGGNQKQYTGVVKGGPIYSGPNFSARGQSGQFGVASIGTGLIGFALEDCEEGALCKVGVGPAIINLEGTNIGDTIMAFSFADMESYGGIPVVIADGQRGLMINSFIPHGGLVVGYGVAKDAVLINPMLDYKGQLEAARAWNTPYEPGPSSNN